VTDGESAETVTTGDLCNAKIAR